MAPDRANRIALDRIEAWLGTSIQVHQTIGVETVLSSFKYRKWLKRAQALGYEVRLIYVLVASAELQHARIRGRVAQGGHDVPADKVEARRLRSFRQFAWFCRKADRVVLYDNSTSEPKLVAVKDGERGLTLLGSPPEDFMQCIRALGIRLGARRCFPFANPAGSMLALDP